MNLLIKLKPNTDIEWFFEKLFDKDPSLKNKGIISEVTDVGHISIFVSVDDKKSTTFIREVMKISPQVVSVSRA